MSEPTDTAEQGRISARLVEEGYVSLQEKMRTYRQARNQTHLKAGLDPGTDPVVMLQDAVETFYHIIRPYVEHEPRLTEYWRGALASYPDKRFPSADHALAYFEKHSVGVYQSQSHPRSLSMRQQQLPTGGGADAAMADGGDSLPMPKSIHKYADLTESVRVLAVDEAFDDEDFDGYYFIEGRFAVVGLQEVRNWRVSTKQTRSKGSGFMAGESSTDTVADPEPAAKVETVAEMLIDIADELNAIASFEPSGDRVHGTPVPDS
jgi:hypothetical protein